MTVEGVSEGAEPRPAATLVIVRDGPTGPEVLLTIRPDHLRFMGGAAVFPGGAIAAADGHPDWTSASTLTPDEAAAAIAEPPLDALGAFVCALRESFEEVGFLLADGSSELVARPQADDPERFREACLDAGVVLRTDQLIPAGRWVTPLGAPVRFDTRFFVARAPQGWQPDPDPSEVAEARWVAPSTALEGLTTGRFMMAPPTIETLQRLADHPDVDALLGALEPTATPAQRLSPLVQLVVAPNPGLMTGPGTNCYIVGSGPSYVIDPGDSDEEFIERVLASAPDLAAVLITHRHADHVGGVARIRAHNDVPVRAFGSKSAGGVAVTPLQDEEVLPLGSTRLIALHTPGHASDHLCFYLEGAASLFAGDNVLGQGTAVIAPPDGNMRSYLASLRRLRERHISRIYPGHFDPLGGGDRIVEDYLRHRSERADAILEVLRHRPATIDEVVGRVYVDTPAALHPIAAVQVQAVLEMLEEDHVVSRSGNRWSTPSVD